MDVKNREAHVAVSYFQGLREEIICAILECSYIKDLQKGSYLFMADEVCSHLYIVKEGLVEIFQLGEEGKKIILHHATRGALLGDTILFNEGTYGANAYAVVDSELFAIGKKSFEELIHAYPEIGIRMLSDFGRRIERLKSLVAEIALNDVRKRIVKLLLELAGSAAEGCLSQAFTEGRKSVILTNVPTQDEMAHRIGTVREVLCRGLHKLEKDNIVKVKRGNIIIGDISKLRELVLEESGDTLFPIILPTKKVGQKGGL